MKKKLNKEELKNSWFNNPIFSKIKDRYPDRDYDFQFELLWDWWVNEKGKPPLSISAFDNWLSRSKVDESIILKRRSEYIYDVVKPDMPINLEGLEAYRKMKERFGKKLI